MAGNKKTIQVLLRDGSSRQHRLPDALQPGKWVKVDEHSMNDLLMFAREFAKNIKYYNYQKPDGTVEEFEDGTWQDFFDFDAATIEKEMQLRKNFDPYLVLYLAFLQIFAHAQKHLEGFTKRHVDYYYEKVLGLQYFKGSPDQVHVIFELAKNSTEQFLEAKSQLDAGKDADGKKLVYKTQDEILINDAGISDVKAIYTEPGKKDVIHYATAANSSDGLGGKLNEADPKWKAFGNKDWPLKKTGFALASSILELKEGTRKISADIILSGLGNAEYSDAMLNNAFEIFFSGEKEWAGPYLVSPGLQFFGAGSAKLTINCTLDKDDPAITSFNPAALTGKYAGIDPVMQILFASTITHNLYSVLKNAVVDSININIDVKGITGLKMQNDQGDINAKKPFTPFGALPVAGSSFYIGCDEIMKKKMDFSQFNFSFKVNWLDAPEKFHDHYKYYSMHSVMRNSYFTADYILKGGHRGETKLFKAGDARMEVVWPYHENDTSPVFQSVKNNYYIKQLLFFQPYKSPLAMLNHPNYIRGTDLYPTAISKPKAFTTSQKALDEDKGFIRFELKQDFFHKEFPALYAVKMKKADSETDIPNQPYTPTIKSIELDYNASTNVIKPGSVSFPNYQHHEIDLYHIGIFGEAEQNGFLKTEVQKSIDKIDNSRAIDLKIYLAPPFNNEGELLLGLTKAEAGQSLSILFQLAEGSSDPQKTRRTINWSVLCSNEWLALTAAEIPADDTNHLLRSGIIKFILPVFSTTGNTLMEEGKTWLRATINEDVDAVCQFINLNTQAVKAIQSVADETPVLSANTLAANAISKLVTKIAAIKKVKQPYSSFNGQQAETDSQFYTRVCERLRHKDRSVSAWDYEHLVLQKFPQVYKVKCLQHSSHQHTDACCTEIKPGYVTLVTVPDLKNKNAVNPLEPKLNTDIMTQIEDFISTKNSFFLKQTIKVQNPDYEQIKLSFKVRFSAPGDFGYYSSLLNRAITEYLSPWAFNSNANIQFGGRARKSVLINFIEEQDYVDFITLVKMFHVVNGEQSPDADDIIITNPRAILVSARQHEILRLEENESCL